MNNDTSRLEDLESDCILFLTFMREVESRRFSIGEDLTASSPMPTSGQQQGIVSFLHDKGIQDPIPIFAAMRFYVFEAFKTMMHQQSYNIGEAFWTSFYECQWEVTHLVAEANLVFTMTWYPSFHHLPSPPYQKPHCMQSWHSNL